MSINELDISWATTADERHHLRWELLAADQVCAVFLTARDDVLAILFAGEQGDFKRWARTLLPSAVQVLP